MKLLSSQRGGRLRVVSLLFLLSMLLPALPAVAQKFYYEGGYFEKNGTKWNEYKPQERTGVWNTFTETDSFDPSYYVIDNGLCKVAVPKSSSKDFLILLKGQDKWQFKYKSVSGASDMVGTPFVSQSNRVRDRLAFHRAYFNEGGVCILSAYCLLLEYANSTDAIIPSFDSYDVMSEYLKYHNSLEPLQLKSASYIRDNHKAGEKYVSDAINGYCMSRGWSGLIQLVNFHDWLAVHQDYARHVEVAEHGIRRLGKMGNTNQGLPFAYERISHFMMANSDPAGDYDHAAVIVYYVPEVSSYHAVFLGYDKDGYFMRGPNFYDKFTDNVCDFGFRFGKDAQVVDYLVMKIKRPTGEELKSGWKYLANTSAVSGALKVPVGVKSVRINPSSQNGGTLRMVSKSNPSFVVELSPKLETKHIRVNGLVSQHGRLTSNGMVEFDMQQICPDLQIVSYTSDFNIKDVRYQ